MAAEDALVLIALNAQVLQKKGDAAFRLGDFQGSFSNYSQAIGLLESLPDSYPPERPMLMAKCKAGLSGACGGLTRFEESLRFAEEALQFYDRCRFLDPVGSGWYTVTFNKGASLVNLGRLAEGMEWIRRAKAMLPENAGSQAERVRCDNALSAIAAAQRRPATPKGFWGKLRGL